MTILLRPVAVGVVVALLPGLPWASRPVAQVQTPAFRTRVAVIPLDVRVLDREGRPVNDLTPGDFTIFEDGVRQSITHFERRLLTPDVAGAMPSLSSGAPFSIDVPNRRIFYIELGRLWLGTTYRFGLAEALTKFLRERLLPQDYAVVSSFGRMTDLTNDHEALAQVVERIAALHARIGRIRVFREQLYDWRALAPDAPIRRAFDDTFAPATAGLRPSLTPDAEFRVFLDRVVANLQTEMSRGPVPPAPGGSGAAAGRAVFATVLAESVRTDVLRLLGAVQFLRYLEGEKHLLYVPGDGDTSPASVDDDRGFARIANDARVAFHVISRTEGLSPGGRLRLSADMAAKNTTRWTGGSAFINQWPEQALATIDGVTRSMYLLAYAPLKATPDERYRKIDVRVRRPDGARVMVRDSYLATDKPPEYDPPTFRARQHIFTVAAFQGGVDDLDVTATAKVAAAGTLSANVTIDVSRVMLAEEGDRHVGKLELAVLALDRGQRIVGQHWVTIDLNVRDDTLARIRAEGVRQTVTVPLTGVARYVKAVAYDYGTTRAGAAIAEVK